MELKILKGTSGFSWFYEQQTYKKKSLTRTLKAGGGSGNNKGFKMMI